VFIFVDLPLVWHILRILAKSEFFSDMISPLNRPFQKWPKWPKWPKLKLDEKYRLKSLQLSKFTPSTAQQSAAHSDDRLKSYGQKTPFFGHFDLILIWPIFLTYAIPKKNQLI
jgi:hypothetical protein